VQVRDFEIGTNVEAWGSKILKELFSDGLNDNTLTIYKALNPPLFQNRL
jgi:hypothetical protein